MADRTPSPEALADSVLDAAMRLGISRTTVYEEINKGRLKSVKCGKRRLVTREAQQQWLAGLPTVEPKKAI